MSNTASAQTPPLDFTFRAPFFATPELPARVRLQPDGKFLVYFNIDTLTDQPTGAIIRYLADGTLDTTFRFSPDYSGVIACAPLASGKLIVAATRSTYGNDDGNQYILRLNSDGSIDSTFNAAAAVSGSANPLFDGGPQVREIAIQPDGKILLAGFFGSFQGTNYPGIVRLLVDGSLDPTFPPVSLQFGNNGLGLWGKPAVQPDGKIIIIGDFIAVNNVTSPGVTRLNPTGSVDLNFPATGFSRTGDTTSAAPIRGAVLQTDGKIVLGGKFTVAASFAANPTGATFTNLPLIRLNPDGTADQTYGSFANLPNFFRIRDVALQGDGKVVGVSGSVYRFNPNGSLDSTFRQPLLLINQDNTKTQPEAFTLNLQSDGRFLIGGSFTDIDDASLVLPNPRFGIGRINSDGTLNSLTTSRRTGIKAVPREFVRLPDGSTIIAFNDEHVSSFDGSPTIPHNFGRLLANGSLDPSFNPFANVDPSGPLSPDFIAGGFFRLADGKFLIGGTKGKLGAFSGARLLPDFTVDSTFTPDSATFQNHEPFPLPDGKLLLTSQSAQDIVDGKILQRLTIKGAIDTTLQPAAQLLADTVQRDASGKITTVVTGEPTVLAVFADGSFLFAYYAADNTCRLVRLTSAGAIDPSFQGASIPFTLTVGANSVIDPQNPGAGAQLVTELSADTHVLRQAQLVAGNKLVIVGEFTSYKSSNVPGIVRINFDGSVDSTFQIGAGPQLRQSSLVRPYVRRIGLQGDGRLLFVGTFDAFNGFTAPGIARLNADGSFDSQFVAPASLNQFDTRDSSFAAQLDGSFLLSGPYNVSAFGLNAPVLIRITGPPVIASPLAATAVVGQQLFYQFETTGATSLGVGNQPAGMTFTSSLALVSWKPSAVGTYQIALNASNAQGGTNATLTITVLPAPSSGPVITSSTSATGKVAIPFKFQVTSTGASATARVVATGLPPGLIIDAVTGIISGTATAEGSSAVTLTVSNGSISTTATLQLTFTADQTVPVIISGSAASVALSQPFSYTIVAPTSAGSTDPTSFTLIGTLPLGLTFDAKTGTISGVYNGVGQRTQDSGDQRSLSGGVITNVQLFATNSHGTTTIPLVFFNAPTGAVNIATRIAVGTGDDVLIGGFIITGNAPKKVVIRAIAPSVKLNGQPVPGTLRDPVLELYDATRTLLGSNDDWRSNQEKEIIDTTVPPTDDHESAIVATLNPGNYSSIVRGKGTDIGIGLVEIYDLGTASLDTSSTSKLAQISTRGTVQTGDNVMIGGFIISGAPSKVIVRAIGPELTAFGVPGALQDPTLELRDGSGSLVIANDDWRTTQEQAIIDTTVAPKDDRESAVVATLSPGGYSAVVRGKDNTTGVALVEVYSLQ